MIKAILFDLDMTLIDFMKMKRIACEQAASAMIGFGLKMDLETASKKLLETYFEEGIESDTAFERFIKEQTGKENPEMLASAINAYLKTKEVFLEPYPQVIPTFIQLIKKGIKLGIVTDAPKLKALQRLHAIGLYHFFDTIITDAGKPSEKPFLEAVKKLGVKPEETLMVGDWPEKDITGAKKTGLKTCWAKYGHHIGKLIKADYEIDSVDEILKMMV